MSMSVEDQALYQHDLELTQANRLRLRKNRNLLFWYEQLYKDLFRDVPDIASKRILEIGSGTSPLKMFLPNVVTTDILKLDHLDIVFDCHDIADFSGIADHSIDVITLTNVLHHLRDPMTFLHGATRKLAKGGQIFLVEPYFSAVSYPLLKLLHHEPVDFSVSRPVLDRLDGPLSSSNQAIPHMIFLSRPKWREELRASYDMDQMRIGYFTSLAYMVTGGISKTFPVPHWLYRPYFALDRWLAHAMPRVFASFFSIRLRAKQ